MTVPGQFDEEDPQSAEYLAIAKLFLPEFLARLQRGALTAPVEVVLSDTAGTLGTWHVNNFGKFVDLADTAHVLRRIQFPVEVLFTDKDGETWEKHIEKLDVKEVAPGS